MDVVFGTLQNDRRRHVLEYVRDHGSTTQSELARHVAAMENGIPPEAVDSTQRKRVYISLYQSHLSKLADAGAIAYDPDRGTVERTPMTAEFLEYLERAETPTPNPVVPRARHTLAGAALLLVAVAVPLVPGTGTGSGFSVASVFALVLASLACGLVVRGIVQ